MSASVPSDDACPFCGAPVVERPDGTVVCEHEEPSHDTYPQFDLGYAYDDQEIQEQVTIFPRGDINSTEWLTIESGYALPIEEVR